MNFSNYIVYFPKDPSIMFDILSFFLLPINSKINISEITYFQFPVFLSYLN